MNGRPIYTLEEDLQQLGVLSEMDPAARKAEMFAKQQARKQAQFAKQQARKQAQFAKKNPMPPQMADIDFEDDDVVDEARTKVHKMRGIAKIMARIRSRKYYRKMKKKLKRLRGSALFKRHKAKLAKMGKTMRGFRRKVQTTGKSLMARLGLSKGRPKAQTAGLEFDAVDALAEVADALNHTTNVGHFSVAYQSVGMLARELEESVSELAEDYVSTMVDYTEVAEAAQGISNEALEFSRAVNEHDGDISGSDLALLGDHLAKLVEELENLAEIYDVNVAAIDLTEGYGYDDDEDDDDEDDFDGDFVSDEELEEMIEAGVLVVDEDGDLVEAYTEGPLSMSYGHGNDPSSETFNVMHPLGISRVDQREKLILARQVSRETAEDYDLDDDDLL